MSVGPVQIIIVVLLALIFFGRGRISEMMGDVGKGISSFKKGLSEDPEKTEPTQRIEGSSATKTNTDKQPDKKL
jgi:sec-independent protein translocase protein TatA